MKKIIYIFFIFMVTSCSFAPKYQRPNIDLPEKYSSSNGVNISDKEWWKHFNSEILNNLVNEAVTNNKDIALAIAKVEQSAAMFTSAKSGLYPKLNAEVEASETWIKGNKVNSSSPPFLAGLNVSWQIDLFGRYRNTAKAAKASLISNQAVAEGVILSVIGQTISGFYLLKSLDLQLEIAKRTLLSRQKSIKIYEERYKAGLISLFDYSQMKSSLEEAKTALYNTKISRENAEVALMVLLGKSPKEITENVVTREKNIEDTFIFPVIPAGLPSTLLERRPDIKSAEQQIISANANIGVAKAMWFPNISLTGLFGIVSNEFESLFTNPMLGWNYTGALTMPLLNFGEVSSKVRQSEAVKKEAIINYEKTVQKAFADLRNSLLKQNELQNILKSLEVMRNELQKAYDIAIMQYERGYIAYLDLLDTERNLFETELNLAATRSDYISAIVDVCIAIGGSLWEEKDN